MLRVRGYQACFTEGVLLSGRRLLPGWGVLRLYGGEGKRASSALLPSQ